MLGEEYTGYKRNKDGKVTRTPGRRARQMGPLCNSKVCRESRNRHCFQLTEDVRAGLFHNFWNTFNWDQRKAYVASHVNIITPKQKINEQNSSRHSVTYVYSLNVGAVKEVICKKTFLNTLGIKEWMAHN